MAAELTLYRRMAHHLAAAHRYRQRIRATQVTGPSLDATDHAEAVLDARGRIVHAIGPAKERRSQVELSYERSGQRYVVARDNQPQISALSELSDRERQVVAYLAIGQSTKETAYALGISDATVRVLLARAATKLGLKTRRALLAHPEVLPLVPK